MSRALLLFPLALVLASAPRSAAAEPVRDQTEEPELRPDAANADPSASQPDAPWCDSDVEALTPTVCHYSPEPPERAPDTLVIFLHGVIKDGTTWQYALEHGMQRAAKANHFEVIVPKGRLGAGSKKFADHWNWPTSMAGQTQVETEVLDEWTKAKAELEKRNGKPFAHVYIFGFSAGAYYATSLALRGKFPVDGYAVFAGGAAPKGVEHWVRGAGSKPPIYVGYGHKDKAKKDPQKLGRALKALGWRSKVVGRAKVGHSMTDTQIHEALAFLTRFGAADGGSSSEKKPERTSSAGPPRAQSEKLAKKTRAARRHR